MLWGQYFTPHTSIMLLSTAAYVCHDPRSSRHCHEMALLAAGLLPRRSSESTQKMPLVGSWGISSLCTSEHSELINCASRPTGCESTTVDSSQCLVIYERLIRIPMLIITITISKHPQLHLGVSRLADD